MESKEMATELMEPVTAAKQITFVVLAKLIT